MEEIWKEVCGYEGLYEISSIGNFRSCDRVIKNRNHHQKIKGRLRKTQICRTTGYYMVTLNKNGKCTNTTIHRLMAEAFIPNPENKPFVDHINGIRSDNRIENLRWCTNQENLTFPIAAENRILCKQCLSKKVAQMDKETGKIINVYRSTGEVQRQNGFHQQNIVRCCNGVKPSMYGYKWKYISEDEYRNYQKQFQYSDILTD